MCCSVNSPKAYRNNYLLCPGGEVVITVRTQLFNLTGDQHHHVSVSSSSISRNEAVMGDITRQENHNKTSLLTGDPHIQCLHRFTYLFIGLFKQGQHAAHCCTKQPVPCTCERIFMVLVPVYNNGSNVLHMYDVLCIITYIIMTY